VFCILKKDPCIFIKLMSFGAEQQEEGKSIYFKSGFFHRKNLFSRFLPEIGLDLNLYFAKRLYTVSSRGLRDSRFGLVLGKIQRFGIGIGDIY